MNKSMPLIRARKRRMKVRRITTFIITASLMFNFITAIAEKKPEDQVFANKVYVVQNHDTLWDIALRNYPDHDPRKIVDMIREDNQINSVVIHAGQELMLKQIDEQSSL